MAHGEETDTKTNILGTEGEEYNDGIAVDAIQGRCEDVKI